MQQWTIDDLIDHWTLIPSERDQLANKTGATRLEHSSVAKKRAGIAGRDRRQRRDNRLWRML